MTAAATRLGLTQSAVSHALNKLRRIAGDPLFAKSGRGIVATAHAQALAAKARALIDEMRSFAGGVTFEPASAQLSLTIAANDFQRDLLLPRFFGSCRRAGEEPEPARDPLAVALACDAAREPLRPPDHAAAAIRHRHRAEAAAAGSLRLLLRSQGARRAGQPRRLSRRAPHHRGLHRQRAARLRPPACRQRLPPRHRHLRAELLRRAVVPARLADAGEHAEPAGAPA